MPANLSAAAESAEMKLARQKRAIANFEQDAAAARTLKEDRANANRAMLARNAAQSKDIADIATNRNESVRFQKEMRPDVRAAERQRIDAAGSGLKEGTEEYAQKRLEAQRSVNRDVEESFVGDPSQHYKPAAQQAFYDSEQGKKFYAGQKAMALQPGDVANALSAQNVAGRVVQAEGGARVGEAGSRAAEAGKRTALAEGTKAPAVAAAVKGLEAEGAASELGTRQLVSTTNLKESLDKASANLATETNQAIIDATNAAQDASKAGNSALAIEKLNYAERLRGQGESARKTGQAEGVTGQTVATKGALEAGSALSDAQIAEKAKEAERKFTENNIKYQELFNEPLIESIEKGQVSGEAANAMKSALTGGQQPEYMQEMVRGILPSLGQGAVQFFGNPNAIQEIITKHAQNGHDNFMLSLRNNPDLRIQLATKMRGLPSPQARQKLLARIGQLTTLSAFGGIPTNREKFGAFRLDDRAIIDKAAQIVSGAEGKLDASGKPIPVPVAPDPAMLSPTQKPE